jgi:GMP synthase-like glutamine amidotransferase
MEPKSLVPAGGEILATNVACPAQAFRVGSHAYGLQYHCEITASTVDDWRSIDEYNASLEQALGPKEARRLHQTVDPRLADFHCAAERLSQNFMSIVRSSSAVQR